MPSTPNMDKHEMVTDQSSYLKFGSQVSIILSQTRSIHCLDLCLSEHMGPRNPMIYHHVPGYLPVI